MTAPVGKAPAPPSPPKQVEQSKEQYQCQVVLEKTTLEKAEDRKLPTDAFNVRYIVEGKEYLDVTRSEKMAHVFDRYYDTYGPNSVKSIEYGCGNVRPSLWNVKPPEKKRRKRRMKDE